jgi:hypothetical protein
MDPIAGVVLGYNAETMLLAGTRRMTIGAVRRASTERKLELAFEEHGAMIG